MTMTVVVTTTAVLTATTAAAKLFFGGSVFTTCTVPAYREERYGIRVEGGASRGENNAHSPFPVHG